MDNSRIYLLKAIAGYKTNGFESLGEFHAKHFEDIAKLMNDFIKDSLTEICEKLNEGKTIDVNGMILSLNEKKRKKK